MGRGPTVPVVAIGGTEALRLIDLVAAPGDGVLADAWYGPGSVRIKADVAHPQRRRPASPVRLDVVDGLLRAVRRAERPHRALLAAGNDEDIATAAYTVLADPDLMRHVHLGSVVMVIDAVATATRIASAGPVGEPLEVDGLAMADLIVLARTDELTASGRTSLDGELRGLNGLAPILSLADDATTIRAALNRPDRWRGAPGVEPRQAAAAPARHGHPRTVVLRQTTPLDPEAVEGWLDRLIDANANGILRLQGTFAIESSPARVLCHGVRSFALSRADGAPGSDPAQNESIVAIVGHGLDVDELASDFAATRSA